MTQNKFTLLLSPDLKWGVGKGVKRPGDADDHSPPPSNEIKNPWSYTSTPSNLFMEDIQITLPLHKKRIEIIGLLSETRLKGNHRS